MNKVISLSNRNLFKNGSSFELNDEFDPDTMDINFCKMSSSEIDKLYTRKPSSRASVRFMYLTDIISNYSTESNPISFNRISDIIRTYPYELEVSDRCLQADLKTLDSFNCGFNYSKGYAWCSVHGTMCA